MRKQVSALAGLLLCAVFLLMASGLAAQQDRLFVGSKSSKKFHTMQCASGKKISEKNRIVFHSVAEASKAGYKPCKICKPSGR